MRIIKTTGFQEQTNTYMYENGWSYVCVISRNVDNKRISKQENEHIIIDENGNRTEINSDYCFPMHETVSFVILQMIGDIYPNKKGWRYFIKLDCISAFTNQINITHFIEHDGIIEQIPYSKGCKIIPFSLINSWAKFRWVPPRYTGNKTLCESMIKSLELALKKYGKTCVSPHILTEAEMKEIEIILVMKKLLQ